MILFFILFVTATVAFIVQNFLRIYRLNKCVKNVSFVPISIMKKFVTFNYSAVDTFNTIDDVLRFRNGLSKFWLGTKLILFCDDPANTKLILMSKNCVERPDFYRFIAGTGESLLTAHGSFGVFSTCECIA